ncbi:MAG: DUF3489 domain-containing protein [Novosphingobium sp.]|nr:DUF3489 domain-containing protein [Novosphingobium sp.]MCP5403795.1 DUF3489 domain-containing protein [Novosphingobium sp.]
MTKNFRLNDLQLVLLSNAASRDNGSLLPLPVSCTQDTTRIRKAVASLLRRDLVEEIATTDRNLCWREEDQDYIGLFITDSGRSAIGVGTDQETQEEAFDAAAATSDANEQVASAKTASPRVRSKIGAVIALLQRDEGATLDEMVEATGWLPHTTRAALTGLRKKGHSIEKTKRGDVTCYRIAAEG